MFVLNPHTNKPIKVFGRTYRRLVEQGLIEHKDPHPEVLCEENDQSTIDAFNKEFYRSGEPYQAVRGRGCFEGKAVVRRLPRNWPPTPEVSEASAEGSEASNEDDEEEEEYCNEEDVYE